MLAQFLNDSQTQLVQDLLTLKAEDSDFKVKAFALTQQINLLGTVRRLPEVILGLKNQFEKLEQLKQDQKEAAYDPLAKE